MTLDIDDSRELLMSGPKDTPLPSYSNLIKTPDKEIKLVFNCFCFALTFFFSVQCNGLV